MQRSWLWWSLQVKNGSQKPLEHCGKNHSVVQILNFKRLVSNRISFNLSQDLEDATACWPAWSTKLWTVGSLTVRSFRCEGCSSIFQFLRLVNWIRKIIKSLLGKIWSVQRFNLNIIVKTVIELKKSFIEPDVCPVKSFFDFFRSLLADSIVKLLNLTPIESQASQVQKFSQTQTADSELYKIEVVIVSTVDTVHFLMLKFVCSMYLFLSLYWDF